MRALLLLLIGAWAAATPIEDMIEGHNIMIKSSPQAGLLFEKYREVKFMRETWKIVVYLDVNWGKYNLSGLDAEFERVRKEALKEISQGVFTVYNAIFRSI